MDTGDPTRGPTRTPSSPAAPPPGSRRQLKAPKTNSGPLPASLPGAPRATGGRVWLSGRWSGTSYGCERSSPRTSMQADTLPPPSAQTAQKPHWTVVSFTQIFYKNTVQFYRSPAAGSVPQPAAGQTPPGEEREGKTSLPHVPAQTSSIQIPRETGPGRGTTHQTWDRTLFTTTIAQIPSPQSTSCRWSDSVPPSETGLSHSPSRPQGSSTLDCVSEWPSY